MTKCSEYVSLGHPDKVADYISQYLLDRFIEKDPDTRYAVEVQIKDFNVCLGGEVSSRYKMTKDEIITHVRNAVSEIGYNDEYVEKWGKENSICGSLLEVTSHIGQQSRGIAKGLDGWGDQGIFFGYATPNVATYGMPKEHTVAKRICKKLFEAKIGGLDIKTQVVTRDNRIWKIIVAIPEHPNRHISIPEIKNYIGGLDGYELIVNGTGYYVQHSSIADCGTTGRKLAVDFYGGNSLIGGGCPWTKDGSKADLTLNLLSRNIAKRFSAKTQKEIHVSLSCCIGKKAVDCFVQTKEGITLLEREIDINPSELRRMYKLDTPIYASMCRWGLFGEFQTDKEWEKIDNNSNILNI